MIFEAMISLKNSHFSFHTSETVSESKKNKSIQSFFVSSKSTFFQTFESEHQEIFIQKTVISSSFRFHAFKSVCRAEKKSTVKNVTTLFVSQELQIFAQKNTKTISQIDSSKRSNFLITTFEITFEYAKSASVFFTEIAKVAEIIKSSIANIRAQTARIRVRIEIERAIFQLSTFESASKFVKKFSIQQIVCARICRRCKQSFNFNNKFHEHIRQHHARKSIKSSDFRVSTCKIKKKSTTKCSFVSFASTILLATSRSQISLTKIISQFLSSKCSNLSISTHKINSKSIKSAIVNCSLIAFFISSHTSVRKHQKLHIQKFYLTMNDLHRMFVEKFKSYDSRQHQNRYRFSQNFDFRQFDRSCSIFSKKLYLIIENLFKMFSENLRKKNLFYSQKNLLENQMSVFFRDILSNQMRIVFYFKFTVNQKSSISRNSKNSKSKNLNQHMFAKSIRTVFSENLFDKSIDLSCKLSNVFCHLKFSNSNRIAKVVFFIFIFFRLFSILLFVLANVYINALLFHRNYL